MRRILLLWKTFEWTRDFYLPIHHVVPVLICISILWPVSVLSQCPEKAFLQKRLESLQHNTKADLNGRLTELLKFEGSMKGCIYEKDSIHIKLIEAIADTYYSKGEFLLAIKYTRHAIDLLNSTRARNYHLLSKGYYNLYVYFDSLNLTSQKNEAVDSCIANESKIGDQYYYTSLVLKYKVRSLYFMGDYHSCLSYASLGEKLGPRYYHAADSLDYQLYFVNYQTDALYSLGYFDQAEELVESRMHNFLKQGNNYYAGIMYGLISFINKSKKEYDKSIKYFKKANQSFLFAKKKAFSSQMLFQIGRVYLENKGSVHIALRYYFQALAYSDIAADSFYMYGNIAKAFVKLKRYDSAYRYFQAAFDKIKPGIDENGLLRQMDEYVNANVTEYVVNVVLDKADAFLQQFRDEKKGSQLRNAISVYRTADRLLNNIKGQQSGIESKLFWPAYARRLYEHAIEASWLENNAVGAFYFFERSRAAILYDQLNQQSKFSRDDILVRAQLDRNLLQSKRELVSVDASSKRYLEIQTEILGYDQQIKKLGLDIQKSNPLYYQSVLDTSFITLKDVRQTVLKDHQVFLELFSGDSAVYSLEITEGEAILNKIGKSGFDSTTGNFVRYVSNPDLLNSHFGDYITTASHLYHMIFKDNPIPPGRIIVSPDGQYFPFEALVAYGSDQGSPGYFLNDHIVSYTYSARFMMANFNDNKTIATGDFLGVAPVQYFSGNSLPALLGSDLSLNQIGKYFGRARNLIAADASRNNFQQQFSRYKIIQLYTHASDSSSNGEPVIYFADSTLYLSDLIPENRPQTRLVVLSACETGTGKFYQGEGVFSFNRGFASLGIPASITNLWDVENKSTYEITELFYKYLSSGLPIDVSLQKAKLEFIQNAPKGKKLPYYWAASILAGRSEAILQNKPFPWKDLLVVLTLMGLTFFVWRKWWWK